MGCLVNLGWRRNKGLSQEKYFSARMLLNHGFLTPSKKPSRPILVRVKFEEKLRKERVQVNGARYQWAGSALLDQMRKVPGC